MSEAIYLLDKDGELVRLTKSDYDSESVLQQLLAKYPDLLAGDQINSVSPCKWLFIAREVGVPCEEQGADRWSLDHLFIDQEGIPTLVEVKRGTDIVNKYLLLSNSHDGTSSVQVKFTPIRVVCQNTLTMALSEGRTVRVSHTPGLHARLRQAENLLGIVRKRFGDIERTFREMAAVQVGSGRLEEYLKLVFPDPQDPEDEQAAKKADVGRARAEYFFSNGKGNNQGGIRGTLWAAYNGITEMVDHRQTQQTDERRLDSVWFGSGYTTKARAFSVAQGRIKAWQN